MGKVDVTVLDDQGLKSAEHTAWHILSITKLLKEYIVREGPLGGSVVWAFERPT